MARDAVTITSLTLDAGTDLVAGTAIAPADGATIAAGGNTEGLLIWVSNTESAAYDVTVVAGTVQEAVRSGIGNLVYEVGAGEEAFIVIESARFAQDDGAIYLNFETGMTGFAAAYRLPAGG
jgi:hypothetical protein